MLWYSCCITLTPTRNELSDGTMLDNVVFGLAFGFNFFFP
jgi:hypothetical protein